MTNNVDKTSNFAILLQIYVFYVILNQERQLGLTEKNISAGASGPASSLSRHLS